MLELLDPFLRRMHGNGGGRRETAPVRAKEIRQHAIQGPAGGPPQLSARIARHGQPERRIDDREVDADLVHSIDQKLRHHGRGEVAGVPGGYCPEGRPRRAPVAAFLGRLGVPAAGRRVPVPLPCRRAVVPDPAVAQLRTGNVLQIVLEERNELDDMTVAIDYGMLQRCTNPG
ncbi:MAG: hypothetical protein ISP45_00930 [Reyranella sp.]|nr:hypothetical protein [Reyranella sp.]